MGCGDSKETNIVESVPNNTYGVTNLNQSTTPVSEIGTPTAPQHLPQPQSSPQQPTPLQQLPTAGVVAPPTTTTTTPITVHNDYERRDSNRDDTNDTATEVELVKLTNGNVPLFNTNDDDDNNNNVDSSPEANVLPEKLPLVEAGIDDPQWQELWLAHKDLLLDPADVYATLQDLMANAINRFSDTELLFLQRRVRCIIRQSQLQSEQQSNNNNGKGTARTMMKKARLPSFSGNSNSGGDNNSNNPNSPALFQELQETANVAKNHHLLTSYVMRKLLPHPPVPAVKCNTEFLAANFMQTIGNQRTSGNLGNHTYVDLSSSGSNIVVGDVGGGVTSTISSGYNDSVSTIQTNETTYILAMFCNDILWDDVADIAVSSAEVNDLEMDVNKQVSKQQQQSNSSNDDDKDIPSPSDPTCDRPPELPLGMGMHALAFIFGIALRGSRPQQLNLLFYLLLPPNVLQQFLEYHPAGGFPTWLLEVGQDSVISLASLSHYYWYGGGSTNSPYLPTSSSKNLDKTTVAPKILAEGWNQEQHSLALTISGLDFIHFLMAILIPEAHMIVDDPSSPTGGTGSAVNSNDNGQNNNRSPATKDRKGSLVGFKRRSANTHKNSNSNSNNNNSPNINGRNSFTIDDAETQQTDVLEQLQRQQQHCYPAKDNTSTSDSIKFLNDYCTKESRMNFAEKAATWLKDHSTINSSKMTILEFDHFCQNSLDDRCISAIMHRLYAQGWIANRSTELDMVRSRWKEWQDSSAALTTWSKSLGKPTDDAMEILSQNIRRVLSQENGGNSNREKNAGSVTEENLNKTTNTRKVFGGLGGFDGRGGTGLGVMYCIDKEWWDKWEAYVGWSWAGDKDKKSKIYDRKPPGELSTERLLDRNDDMVVAGTLGSYEVMKKGLTKDVDYVLVPPAVWDVLYEMYAGGPPLPRMVDVPEYIEGNHAVGATETGIELYGPIPSDGDSNSNRIRDIPTETDLDDMALTNNRDRVLRIPYLMEVITHPWVMQFQLCDPHQPYRKQDYNEAGPLTIRVMASPDQPLWRLYAEVIIRLPFHIYKAYGSDGRGKVRLWKRIDPSGPKDRYGPWPCTLVCKNRFAILPQRNVEKELAENYDELKSNWEIYSDNATVESSDLADESQILVEFAVLNRNNEMIWPREAAAKAGRVRRIADRDMKFRRILLGLNDHGKPMAKSPDLIGMTVDAMDASGRWYEVHITHVKIVDPDTDEEDDDDSMDDTPVQGYKQVRVDFSKYGGHGEWVYVESDRLAAAGRFTMNKGDSTPTTPTKPTQIVQSAANEAKNKVQAQVKKAVQDAIENTKVCTIPGYGACGLANLGNTCYINSALQCISYFPLLRSYLLSGEYKSTGDLNKDNPLGTKGWLLEEFVELLRFMWSSKAGEKSPTRLRQAIAKLKPDVFAGADQQDAQELLSYVLDALMEDSNRVLEKPYVEGLEDDWVRKTDLYRVGEEAWRRERRRSRSIVTDVITGQTLSTTTCPVCDYSSQKFDPFNLLSVPLPTVTDVIFKCYVVRRSNAFNTPWVLNRPKNKNGNAKVRFSPNKQINRKPPSEYLIVEQYIIAMSRLADSGDLRLKIQSVCGIPATDLIICSAEEKLTSKEKDDGTVVRRRTDLTVLTNKKGPCSQFARQRNMNEDLSTSSTSPALIVAFESTLRTRPLDGEIDESSESNHDDYDDDDDIVNPPSVPNKKEEKELESVVMQYGNSEECRLYDTDTLPIAQAVSRSLWPTKDEELKLGLRVDAIDHKKHWYPGSVVEILENGPVNGETTQNADTRKTKVRIHFDNFSSKWDETYSIEHFNNGQVQPLYSHATHRTKPTEFIVHHRYMDRATRLPSLFGQSFYVQCHSEWSTARAGAQILAQASRFLRQGPIPTGPVDIDVAQERETKIDRLYDRTQSVISELIDLLIEGDRKYVFGALAFNHQGVSTHNNMVRRFRNPGFDATSISSSLVKRVNEKLHRLPFEVRVCSADYPFPCPENDEVAFPFSLMRTIGNYLSARHAIVLQWREPPSDKKSSVTSNHAKYSNYLGAPVMYVPPKVILDENSVEILTKANQNAKKTQSAIGSAGMPLGKCLTEFCKIQKLENDEGDTHWRCPRCKDFRPGAKQNLVIWRLPDILTIHMKRFRSSQKWREKINTKVNFPLTGLDMKEWCHRESPVLRNTASGESYVYDLIGVLNHYGGMTGGHYVATCKATPCSKDGREEVAFDFNGVGTAMPIMTEEEVDAPTGWKAFGRPKVEVNENKVTAAATAKHQRESAEPLWLQFDDEVVEPIAPKSVISESAYVLFYRRRRLTPANVARYSSLE
mmetsp:Transcript_42633/g.47649  ORF Transcript_42633/g.47649 Transcript_42633/m.47649 type:complete len:2302 (-) Transcript_42633:77-6982(-)